MENLNEKSQQMNVKKLLIKWLWEMVCRFLNENQLDNQTR